jgi:hypothetical protein
MPQVKRSDIGGQGNDQPFEHAFANVAHAYLRDKAPGLLDFEVGFQLIDRDEDRKAVGVFGFKVGSQWLYAPVFFINGDLKGHELLYIKNEDAFRPLKENWVNYLLAKKPISLGKGVGKQTRHLGVRYPDMLRITQSPHKYAAVVTDAEREALRSEADAVMKKVAGTPLAPYFERMHDWAKVGFAAMTKHASRRVERPLRLLEVLKDGGVKMAADLSAHFRAYPKLRVGFDDFYPPEQVEAAFGEMRRRLTPRDSILEKGARTAPRRAKKASVLDAADPMDVGSLAIVRMGDRLPLCTSDEEKTALLVHGFLIKDARADDEVSKAYAVDVRIQAEKRLSNPTETGIYEVLTKPGSYEKCLVLFGHTGPGRRSDFATVVRLDGGRNWLNIHPSHVWVKQDAQGDGGEEAQGQAHSGEAFRKFLDSLPDADSFETGDRATYIVVGQRGQCTLPFEVSRGAAAGKGSYEVFFRRWARKGRPSYATSGWDYPLPAGDADDSCCDNDRIHLGMAEGSRFRTSGGGDTYVPKGAKKLKVKDAPDYSSDRPEAEPIAPGSIEDVELGILKRADLKRLRIKDAGVEVVINGDTLPKAAALFDLVARHGFREDDAAELLKQASDLRVKNRSFECLVKYADPYGQMAGGSPYLIHDAPGAPGMPEPDYGNASLLGSDAPAQHFLEQLLPATDMQSSINNRDAYYPMDAQPDAQAVGMAEQATERGQKEIFDTAIIGSLLKGTRDDMLVDRHIKSMLDALDHIGRLLFVFYWHGEQFAERYGESDMPELEDSLRNTFEALGDLVLFLRQKTVESTPDEAAQDIDLGAIAAQ